MLSIDNLSKLLCEFGPRYLISYKVVLVKVDVYKTELWLKTFSFTKRKTVLDVTDKIISQRGTNLS